MNEPAAVARARACRLRTGGASHAQVRGGTWAGLACGLFAAIGSLPSARASSSPILVPNLNSTRTLPMATRANQTSGSSLITRPSRDGQQGPASSVRSLVLRSFASQIHFGFSSLLLSWWAESERAAMTDLVLARARNQTSDGSGHWSSIQQMRTGTEGPSRELHLRLGPSGQSSRLSGLKLVQRGNLIPPASPTSKLALEIGKSLF